MFCADILIPQCTRKPQKKKNGNQHNDIHDQPVRNPGKCSKV
jgi:hypothetical protein